MLKAGKKNSFNVENWTKKNILTLLNETKNHNPPPPPPPVS